MNSTTAISPGIIVRALRLPFTTASALPFIFGSFLANEPLDVAVFWLGLLAVVLAHLGANVINDYADSKSGADWHDKRSYQFFGGSKLIQEGVLSERFYLKLALGLSGAAALLLILTAILTGSMLVIGLGLLVLVLSWAYSAAPFKLSYRRLGEIVIFILFGPVPVMGGYYLQTGVFPDPMSFLASLPFGFFTAAILFANEVPDYAEDVAAGKRNLANLFTREHAYLGYYVVSALGFASVVLIVALGMVSAFSLLALLLITLSARASMRMKQCSSNKEKLIESSKISILVHTVVSVLLVAGVLV